MDVKTIYGICINKRTGEILWQSRKTYDLHKESSVETLHKVLDAYLRQLRNSSFRDSIELSFHSDESAIEQSIPF